MIKDDGVLYIEPSSKISVEPVVDELTRGMAGIFRQAQKGRQYRGMHTCACGATSASCEYVLPDGQETNSLCVHYLAYHREEIPASQLEKVRALIASFSEMSAEPTTDELTGRQTYRPSSRPRYRGV